MDINDEMARARIAEIVGGLDATQQMDLAATIIAVRVLNEPPYTNMSQIEKKGFLLFLAEKCLTAALNEEVERELAGACLHLSEPILRMRSGYLGDLPVQEVIRVCGDCGMEF